MTIIIKMIMMITPPMHLCIYVFYREKNQNLWETDQDRKTPFSKISYKALEFHTYIYVYVYVYVYTSLLL